MIINKKESYFFVLLLETIKQQWVAGDPMAVNGNLGHRRPKSVLAQLGIKIFVQIESNCSRKHPSCSAGSIQYGYKR
jgi:hypothetical protein